MKINNQSGIDYRYLYSYTWVLLFIVVLFFADTLVPKRISYPILGNTPYDPAIIKYRHFWSIIHYKYCQSTALKLAISSIILLFCHPYINRGFLDIARQGLSHAHNFFKTRLSLRWFSGLISLSFFLLFWSFRATYLDGDSVMLPKQIQLSIDQGQMLILPDEILPSITNHLSYRFFAKTLDWNIETSIGFLSCLWGGFFVYLLMRMVRYLHKDFIFQQAALLFFFFSGFMRIYFGDVENYALPYLTITLYIYTSIKYLSEDNYPIILPTLVWSLSLLSHVLSLTFAPSLIYIWFYKNRRQAMAMTVTILTIISIAGILGTLSIDISRALHLSNMFSLGTVYKKIGVLQQTPLVAISNRLIATLNEMVLVSLPGLMAVGYFMLFHFREIDFKDRVIKISFINFLSSIFCLLLLGPFSYDWNLFAFVAISNSMLAIILFLRIPLERKHYYHFVIFLVVSLAHTAILIASSHYNWV